MYWAATTLTTVGYGDTYPYSLGGRIFATAFMLFGVITLTIPLLSIVMKFEANYKTALGVDNWNGMQEFVTNCKTVLRADNLDGIEEFDAN